MDRWGAKLLHWEEDLRKALQPRSILSLEEVAKYGVTFTELESPDIPVEVISNSRLPELVGYIAMTRPLSTDPFPFKARASALAKKWRRLETAAASAALSDLFPPSHRPAVPIPGDVLMHILKSYVGDASMNDDRKELRKKMNYLLDCAFVAKDWNAVAINLLYRGPIILDSVESTKLLLRTVEGGLESPCPIQWLKLEQFGQHSPDQSAAEFGKHAALLIPHCTELRYLDIESLGLLFPLEVSMPTFDKLRELRLAGETFRFVAPLLHKLPNLQILRLSWIEAKTPRVRVKLAGSPPIGDPVSDIPSPTFTLKEFHICQCEFSLDQLQWLLSSSTAINYVELQEVYDSADGLASVIGPHVKALHMKGEMDAPQQGDDGLAAVISKFTALTFLRVSGRDWPWGTLLTDIRPTSLATFAISYSKPACENIARVLSDASWQPHLQVLTVYHWADTDCFYGIRSDDVREAKSLLEGACALRKIFLNWTTQGDSVSWQDGPTEADLLI